MDDATRAELETRTEHWFVRRGLPHLIDHYSVTHDIFTRASGFLTVIFLLELLNALNETFEWWQNILALIATLLIAGAGLVIVNRLRGRPPFRRPESIGAIELSAFVIIPGIIPAVVAGQPGQGLEVAIGNIVLLGVVFVVTSYGLVPMTRWATARMLGQMRQVSNLFVRSLPLLLLFTMFMFFNAEMWKITDDIPRSFYWCSIGILVLVGSLFVLLRLPRELGRISTFESWDEVHADAEGSPLEHLSVEGLTDPPAPPELRRRARLNVGLVLFFSQSVQILLVTAAITAFYVLFGMFTIIDTTVAQWTGTGDMEVLGRIAFGDHDLLLTGELVRTSLFIAAVAGLQFTVAALTDSTYRDEFYDELSKEIRQAMAVRDLYLAKVVRPTTT